MKGLTGIIDSKKALFTLLMWLALTAGWLTGKVGTEQWIQYSLLLLGGYFTFETANAIAIGKAKAAPSKLPGYTVDVDVDTSRAVKALDDLKAKADATVASVAAAADPNGEVLT